MKKICNLITALFLTLTLFCSPVLAASAEDTARSISCIIRKCGI